MSDERKPGGTSGAARKAKLHPWDRALREAGITPAELAEAEARGVLEASDEEIERELREAGVDLDAEAAAADATYEAAVAKFVGGGTAARGAGGEGHEDAAWVAPAGGTARAAGALPPRRRSRTVLWMGYAAAAAAATGGAVYVAAHRPHEEPKKDEPVTVKPDAGPVPSPSAVTPPVEPGPSAEVAPKAPPKGRGGGEAKGPPR